MRFQIILSVLFVMLLSVGVQANTDSDNHFLKALSLTFDKDYPAALIAVDKSIQISNTAVAQGLRGTILQKLGRYDEAIEAYKTGIEMRPSDYQVNTQSISECLLSLGRYNEAIDTVNQLIPLSSYYPNYRITKGDALYQLGRYDEAKAAYNEALDLSNQDLRNYGDLIDSINEKLKSIPDGVRDSPQSEYKFEELIDDLKIS